MSMNADQNRTWLILSFNSLYTTSQYLGESYQNNYFSTWPGLTVDLVLRYLPKSEFTSYGYLHQRYKGTRSTKTRRSTNFISVPQVEPDPDVIEFIFPESSDSEITNEV